MKLYLDLETYSDVPIKRGVFRYAEDVDIDIIAWARDDEPVRVIDMRNPVHMRAGLPAFREALDAADEIYAHNAQFDRTILAEKEFHTPLVKWRCTMARAYAHSLPGSLDVLCEVLKVPSDKAKHKRGKQLVQLFCKPLPKNSKLYRATPETHPAEWAEYLAYAGGDVEACRELDKRLPTWNYRGRELSLWHLDQKINRRGICVDKELVDAAIDVTTAAKKELDRQMKHRTAGEIESATQRDKLLQHLLETYGVDLPDMRADTLERRIEDPDLPEPVKELLHFRS